MPGLPAMAPDSLEPGGHAAEEIQEVAAAQPAHHVRDDGPFGRMTGSDPGPPGAAGGRAGLLGMLDDEIEEDANYWGVQASPEAAGGHGHVLHHALSEPLGHSGSKGKTGPLIWNQNNSEETTALLERVAQIAELKQVTNHPALGGESNRLF